MWERRKKRGLAAGRPVAARKLKLVTRRGRGAKAPTKRVGAAGHTSLGLGAGAVHFSVGGAV